MRVVGGTLNKDLMELKSFESSCVAIKPHPGFNFKSRAFDVAIITVRILGGGRVRVVFEGK